MRMEVLYREEIPAPDMQEQYIGTPANYVFVEARKWMGDGGPCDIVFEKRVMIDGDLVVNTRRCESGHEFSRAVIQRSAIAEFDRLLAAHPTLGRRG